MLFRLSKDMNELVNMRSVLLLFVIFTNVVNFGETAVYQFRKSLNDLHLEKCYYYGVKPPLILNPGETAPIPNQCRKALCSEGAGLTVHTCSPHAVLRQCKIQPGDESKPYPDCCPKDICANS